MNKGLHSYQRSRNAENFPILQRIAKSDKTAVQECIDIYGGVIWAMAKKCSASDKEAEQAVLSIFLDIWKCAERNGSAKCSEIELIKLIARRHLTRISQKNNPSSAVSII